MSFRLYDQNSGLDSDNAIEFSRKAILYEESDVNRLIQDHKEKLNHFSAKALMFFILRELRHDVTLEVVLL